MPEISIPKEVVSGFNSILNLSKKSVEKVANYLSNSTVSSDPNNFLAGLDKFIEKDLRIKNHTEIVKTIASFISLLEGNTPLKVSENLSNSFKELYEPEITQRDFLSLKKNLEIILTSCSNLELSIKSFRLIRESGKVYQNSKIVSDIRIVFDKELNTKNRKAVLIHFLHITYKSDSKNKNFFVALGLEDLKSLHRQVERAINKDKIIKTDYKNLEVV